MNIPDCYEAFAQEEKQRAAADRRRNRVDKCGCCAKPIAPGDVYWKVCRKGTTFPVCSSCKEDIDDSISICEEEESPW